MDERLREKIEEVELLFDRYVTSNWQKIGSADEVNSFNDWYEKSLVLFEEYIEENDLSLSEFLNKPTGEFESRRLPYRRLIARIKSIAEKGTNKNNLSTNSHMRNPKNVFIVHGTNVRARKKVTDLITEIGYVPVILSNNSSSSRIIFEKLISTIKDSTFAIVIMSPDDLVKHKKNEYEQARPNVLFEYGLCLGLLKKEQVCLILTDEKRVKKNSDIDGVVHINLKAKDWKEKIKTEMRTAGLCDIQ